MRLPIMGDNRVTIVVDLLCMNGLCLQQVVLIIKASFRDDCCIESQDVGAIGHEELFVSKDFCPRPHANQHIGLVPHDHASNLVRRMEGGAYVVERREGRRDSDDVDDDHRDAHHEAWDKLF